MDLNTNDTNDMNTASSEILTQMTGIGHGMSDHDMVSTPGGAAALSGTEVAITDNPLSSKTKPKSKVEVIPADPVSKTVNTIENLTAKQAAAMATELKDGSEFSLFQLGGVFSVVNAKKYFAEFGHPDFKTWVEKEHAIKYRKAMYLASIYEQVVELKLPWDQIKGLGWTKLKTLLNPKLNLITTDNLATWVEKAEAMTVLQLENLLATQSYAEDSSNAIEQDAGKSVTTMTFKLHPDQKESIRAALEKAKEMSGTTVDTVALEMMAADFLGKPIATINFSTTELPLPDQFKKLGYMGVLEAFEIAFPDISLEVKVPSMD